MSTTYTKLRTGDWGIRIEGSAVRPGSRVTVAKKSGERKLETVDRVLYSRDGLHICSIVPAGRSIGSGASYRAGVTAPGGRVCPQCGSRECSRAWSPHNQCDED